MQSCGTVFYLVLMVRTRSSPQERRKARGAILTPAALKTAQEAAQAVEETLSEFISRAVDTQAKRDKVMFAMRQKELTSAQAGV